jgi:hypothetical protein
MSIITKYPESSKIGIPRFFVPREQKIGSTRSTPSNIWLVNIDAEGNEVERLKIQTVPLEVNVDAIANWAVIPTIGRNNPFYHYTGGEDILKFQLDWYSNEHSREDVIRNCRRVESLSRANGYFDAPPRVVLIFGSLFKYTTWIVAKAPYKLSLFDKELGMLPRQAYQELELRKIVDHNTGFQERRLFN